MLTVIVVIWSQQLPADLKVQHYEGLINLSASFLKPITCYIIIDKILLLLDTDTFSHLSFPTLNILFIHNVVHQPVQGSLPCPARESLVALQFIAGHRYALLAQRRLTNLVSHVLWGCWRKPGHLEKIHTKIEHVKSTHMEPWGKAQSLELWL